MDRWLHCARSIYILMSSTSTNKNLFKVVIPLGVGIVLLIIFWSSFTVTIPSGHAGLMFHTFGNGIDPSDEPMGQGFHFKAPWNRVVQYEVRQQQRMEHLSVLSSNLLKIEMDLTVFFQPAYDKLGYLEVERSKEYKDRVIVPAMRSVAREVIARYLPEEINTTKREQMQSEINAALTAKLAENYVQLNDVLIRDIKLPPKLEEAIERKLQQEQESLEYEFEKLEQLDKSLFEEFSKNNVIKIGNDFIVNKLIDEINK